MPGSSGSYGRGSDPAPGAGEAASSFRPGPARPGAQRQRFRRRCGPAVDTLCAVETILSVAEVAIAVVTVLLILMHSGKDSGLSGAFGVGSGAGPLGGGSLVERNLNRWTVFFAVLFFANALVLLTHPWS
jgi:preprotein translocase subunit SecG